MFVGSPAFNKTRQHGATLVEVLVAMLLLSVGLLAMAGLQRASMRASSSAAHTVAASQIFMDLAEKVRAFPVAADAGAFDGITKNRSGDMEVHLESNPMSKHRQTIRIVWTDQIATADPAKPALSSGPAGSANSSASAKRSATLEFGR